MEVILIDSMGSDLTVANAARVSMNKHKEVFDESDEKLIRYLAVHNHFTPFTHPQITLRVKAPIFVCRQLHKHQVGLTVNEISRRYVDSKPEMHRPDVWRARPDASIKQGSSDKEVKTFDGNYFFDLALGIYDLALQEGVCPEQARMLLPQAMMSEFYWTGSLSAFARVCNLRLDSHAQRETQEVAKMIYDIVEPLFPYSMKALVNV